MMTPCKHNKISAFGLLLLLCFVGVATSGVRAAGGTLAGRVCDGSSGAGLKRVRVWASGHGRSVSRGVLSEGDGSYRFEDLPVGRYAVCVPAGPAHRPVSVAAVDVRDNATTRVDLKVNRSLLIQGDSWLQAYPSFSQSFVATGLGLTMARVKAFGPARQVEVQLRGGNDPRGRLIGPARATNPVGGEGTACVWWSGREVPTVPGARYTLQMAGPSDQKWVCAVAGRGDVYAPGMAYFDGSPRPHSDLGIVLGEDNDDLRTNYALGGGRRSQRVVSTGQTFVALSRNVTFASAVLSGVKGPPVYVRFSIHEGGPGGPQVGPSKGVAAGGDAAVAWGPNEVPVTPGEPYYLHIESFSGTTFLVDVQPDLYADGQAVFNGKPTPDRDLCAMVAGQLSDADFARLVAHPRQCEVVGLANASFEDGFAGWSRQGDTGAVVGCDEGVVPRWGTKMFGWTNRGAGEGSITIIYQHIQVNTGDGYTWSGSVYTDHRGGRSSDVKVRLVVLPAGGTALRDNDQIETSQWYATEGQWRRGSVEFKAAADTITVGFELEQRFSLESSSLYVDGAHLARIGAR